MNGPLFCTLKFEKGRRLTGGARPVGWSTALRFCGWGRRNQESKGRERPSFSSSLLLFYIEAREAYASGGGRGQDTHHHFGFLKKYKASFVEVKNAYSMYDASCKASQTPLRNIL